MEWLEFSYITGGTASRTATSENSSTVPPKTEVYKGHVQNGLQ